jgi:molybdenum cofactor guanylyltransferase
MRAGGVVLCGGRSSRMGRSKALLPFGGETLLQRVVRILREVVDPVVVVAAPGQDLPPLPDGVHIARDDREFLGPLNGLAAGLDALAGLTDVAYVSACDVPFLSGAFARRVLDRMGGVDVAMPDVGGFKHPLAAGYRLSVREAVRDLLDRGSRRLLELTEVRPTRWLTEGDLVDLESLRNVNTPEDFAACGVAPGNAASGDPVTPRSLRPAP